MALMYVCENDHHTPVHRYCVTLFARCDECRGKMLAVLQRPGANLRRSMAAYRGQHTREVNKKLAEEEINFALYLRGFARQIEHMSFAEYRKKDTVTQEQFNEARAEVIREKNEECDREKEEIKQWFNTRTPTTDIVEL